MRERSISLVVVGIPSYAQVWTALCGGSRCTPRHAMKSTCLFDKPVAQGGFAISRYTASGVLAAAIILCVLFLPQRAAEKQH